MKLGVIGYHINSGIGSLIDDLKRFLPVTSHFVVRQQLQGIDANKPSSCPLVIPSSTDFNKQLHEWVSTQSCIICVEFPPHDTVLMAQAKACKVPVACIVDIDWFNPALAWTKDVALYICPNTYTMNCMRKYGFTNIVYIPACVDTEYFRYLPRDLCCEFLFNNGWGGYHKRKGLDIVEQAAHATCAPVHINSQAPVATRLSNVTVHAENIAERRDLYNKGQVYLAPTRCEGYGLHILEAMACGYPVVTTAGPPMTDYVVNPALWIKVRGITQKRESRFSGLWCEPDASSLVRLMQSLQGTSVKELSEITRAHIEKQHSWKTQVVTYMEHLEKLR